jgi:cold shock CspA family protein
VQIDDFQDSEGVHGLEDGESVEFNVEQTPTGPIASDIVPLSSER